MQKRDTTLERWLEEKVLPAYDAAKADPKRAIPAKKVFAAIRAHHVARLKALKHGR